MNTTAPNPVLAALEPLIGEWESEATVDGATVMRGRSNFAWADRGEFLVQTADGSVPPDGPQLWRDNLPFPTVAIMGYDDGFENYRSSTPTLAACCACTR
jgi:hypothetical protein